MASLPLTSKTRLVAVIVMLCVLSIIQYTLQISRSAETQELTGKPVPQQLTREALEKMSAAMVLQQVHTSGQQNTGSSSQQETDKLTGKPVLQQLTREALEKMSAVMVLQQVHTSGQQNTGSSSQRETDYGMIRSVLPKHLRKANQTDPDLVSCIKDQWLIPPSSLALDLDNPAYVDHSQNGQSLILDRLLGNITNGFYIECGAFNGEGLSNTLYFERRREWQGLLIEANPSVFRVLYNKHRKAYLLNACLSPTEQASWLNFTLPNMKSIAGLVEQHNSLIKAEKGDVRFVQLQCFPLYSILLALDNIHVDLLSLDIEGAEVNVLKTIPFTRVNIDMIMVEVGRPGTARDEKVKDIEELLLPYGYRNLHIEIRQDILMSKI